MVQAQQVTQNAQNFLTDFWQAVPMYPEQKNTEYRRTAPRALSGPRRQGTRLPLHGLAALRILIVLVIGIGYASTMGIGTDSVEWGHHWGYDPSWWGVNLLFVLSGFLALRSLTQNRSVLDFFSSRIWSLWPALIAATLVTVVLLYPVMCNRDAAQTMDAGALTLYFFKTIFLIDPGARLPGLLDDAKYMCLMQGAIWTLRWGFVLHVAFLVGHKLRLFSDRRLIAALFGLALLAYVCVVQTAIMRPVFGEMVTQVLPGLRLGTAYLAGTALFAWQDRLRLSWRFLLPAIISFAGLTTLNEMFLPWTPLMEVLGTAFWVTCGLAFLGYAPQQLRRCPRLTPVLYVTIWPAAQVIVALFPGLSQSGVIEFSLVLASLVAVIVFLLLRQANVQPARF